MKNKDCKKQLEEMSTLLEEIVNSFDLKPVNIMETLKGVFEARKKLAKVYLKIPHKEAQKYNSYLKVVDQLISDHMSVMRWEDYEAAVKGPDDHE